MNPAAVPQALTQAQACWQRGDLIQAETLCRQILLRDRANASTYAVLASVLMQGGQIAQAEPVGRQWVAHCPGDAHAHAFLGHVLRELGHTEAAMRCWQHALRLPGEQGDLHYRLGRTLLDLGQDAQALAELVAAQCDAQVHEEALLWQIRVLHRLQRCDQARQLLGDALFRLSTTGQEGQIVKLWLALFPQDEVPNHRLAAQGGVAAPARASDAYVSYLFDHYADSFDVQLAKLHYRAPELIAGQLAQSLPSPQAQWRVLDAGCGTGLCGVWLRPYARELTGVDLSPGMVAKARARGGYDRLVVAELTQFLARQDAAFELIVSADTLVYFGDLVAVLTAASKALTGGGWLAFSLEQAEPGDAPDWQLSRSGRYRHSQGYVEHVVRGSGLHLQAVTPVTLRLNAQLPVKGLIVLASRPYSESI